MSKVKDLAGEYAEACISEGVTPRAAVSELMDAWLEHYKESTAAVASQFQRLLQEKVG